ncbi:MAG: hypothetical protein R3A48_14615 [Polyangiales bacterium]
MVSSLARLALLSVLTFALGCTDASIGELNRTVDASPLEDQATASDAESTDAPEPLDATTPPPDASEPGADVGPVSPDVVAPPLDVVAPRPDVVAPRPDVVTPRPDVVTPRPDVVVGEDRPTTCAACTPFSEVAFCPGTGSGACLAYAGCADNCAVCAPATVAGDTCTNAPTITTRGRSRSVFTTCGVSDNLNAGCGRSGPDIAVILRVSRSGPVSARLTVPPGVGVVFGYDRIGGGCRTDSVTRTCNNSTPQRVQGFDLTLGAGDYTLYIVTTAPSTVVIETNLP